MNKNLKFNRVLGTLTGAFVTVGVLSGCTVVQKVEPPVVQKEVEMGEGFKLEYVKLPDGHEVACLFHNKDSTASSMSCDWENTRF